MLDTTGTFPGTTFMKDMVAEEVGKVTREINRLKALRHPTKKQRKRLGALRTLLDDLVRRS